MTISEIIQKKITELIKFAITGEKIEIGKSVVALLEKILPNIKDELKLDYESFKVNPGAHPRDTADIMLYKKGKVVRKISVKTSVSADIKATIEKMQREKRYDEDGLLVFGLYCVKGEKKEKVFGMILIPKEALYEASKDTIYKAILAKVEEKRKKEKYDYIAIVAINESIILETAATVLETATTALANRKAIEENRKAIEENRRALEENRKAIEENRKAIEENRKAIEENRRALEENRKAIEENRRYLESKIEQTHNEIMTKLEDLTKLVKDVIKKEKNKK